MKILMDLHTHTVASGHAYSSLEANINVAKERGLKYYGLSEHGPKMPGAPHIYYYSNMRIIPREMNGIRVLRGVEANILDYDGTIDMIPESLEYIDYVIASSHPPCMNYGTSQENTDALINAMKHPKVFIIGHPDDDRFPLDYPRLVKAAKEHDVLLEINNSSLNPIGFRKHTKDNIEEILKLCMKENYPVILSSDAHISVDVGNFNYIMPILSKLKFPDELIINYFPEKFLKMIKFIRNVYL